MRLVATLPEDRAELFADHLLTLGIRTRLDPDPGGTAVWVCDEDQMGRATAELEAFRLDPAGERYRQAPGKAAGLRRSEVEADEQYEEQTRRLREDMDRAGRQRQLVLTAGLIAMCTLTFLGQNANEGDRRVDRALRIDTGERAEYELAGFRRNEPVLVPQRYLPDVAAGQVWRLFSPALLHYGLPHLVFNMMWLLYLGGAIEARLGPLWLLGLVLPLAAFSNVAEFFLGPGLTTLDGRTVPITHINFGGMSGVIYGLFGYVWYKSRYHPESGFDVPSGVVTMVMIAFVACWAGLLGPIANVAHTAGLLGGLALGALPWPRAAGGQAS